MTDWTIIEQVLVISKVTIECVVKVQRQEVSICQGDILHDEATVEKPSTVRTEDLHSVRVFVPCTPAATDLAATLCCSQVKEGDICWHCSQVQGIVSLQVQNHVIIHENAPVFTIFTELMLTSKPL